ncbi:MAG: S8 family serine peptidase, partial [Desulfocucumaceae bacterium]
MKRFIYVIALILISTMLYSPASAGEIQGSPAGGQGRDGEKTYLVGLKNQERGLEKAKAKGKVKRMYKHLAVAAVKMTPGKARELEKDSDILFVEPDGLVRAGEAFPWNASEISADLALARSFTGKGIKIAVLDTGIDQSHEDLSVAGGAAFVDVESGLSLEGPGNYTDDNGHGTHVAGIIAALANGKGTIGVASGSALYSVKVLDREGAGTYSQVIAAIDWAIEHDIDIICMSLGGDQYSRAFEQAVQKAYDSGILLVAAAGNGGEILYPAKYTPVVAVGAVDRNKQRAQFSSTGPELEIMAPGVGVESTLPGNKYGTMSGTSAAAPHVAGAAALIWSYRPELTNVQVRDMLKENALPLGSPNEYGYGMVDLSGLFEKVEPPLEEPGSPAIDKSYNYSINKMNFYFNENPEMARLVAVHGLSSEDPLVREHAVKILGEAGESSDLPYLDNIVHQDSEQSSLREQALVSILKLSMRVVPEQDKKLYLLETALKSEYDLAANYAVIQLGRIGGEEARSLAWEALTAETDPVRKSVLESVYAGSAGEGDFSVLSFPEEFTVDPGVTARYAAPSSEVSAQWDPYDSNETNDTRGSATSISEGVWKTGYIGQAYDVDYFRFTASKTGEITVVLDGPNSHGEDFDVWLQNSSGTTLEGGDTSSSDETFTYDVNGGSTYYIKVNGYGGYYSSSPYKLKFTISGTAPVIRDPYEPNNNMGSAKYISLDRNYTAYIDYSGDVDYYRFVPGYSGELEFDMWGPSGKDYDVKLLSSGGSELEGSSGSGSSEYFTYDVTGGNTYYIKIYGYGSSYDSDRSYTFSTSLTNNQATIDMSLSAAGSVNGGQTFTITATVRNESAVTARDVYAVLNQPGGFWLESGETLLKDIGSISPWGSETVSWRLRAETVSSPIDRSFSVQSSGINTNSVVEYDSVRVNPNKTVLSVLSITVPAKVNPGNEFTVEIKVKNSGSITANNARAEITLPSGLSLKSGSAVVSFGNVGAGAEATA